MELCKYNLKYHFYKIYLIFSHKIQRQGKQALEFFQGYITHVIVRGVEVPDALSFAPG